MRTLTFELPDDLADQLSVVQDRLPELLALSLHQPAVPAHLYRTILTFLAGGPTAQEIATFAPHLRCGSASRSCLIVSDPGY